jgi:hypothetical protein
MIIPTDSPGSLPGYVGNELLAALDPGPSVTSLITDIPNENQVIQQDQVP